MMKLGRIFVLFLIVVGLDSMMSCCDCPEPPADSSFSNCGVELENLDNAGEFTEVSTDNEILATAYGIRMSMTRSEEVCMRPSSTFLLGNAMATSCDCPSATYTPRDTVVDLRIITERYFDAAHPMESVVNDLFQRKRGDSFTPLEDLVDELGEDMFDYGFGLETGRANDLMLFGVPDSAVSRQFRVEIELSNGTILSEVTGQVVLQ